MKALIPVVIGLFVAGCGKKEESPQAPPETNATSRSVPSSSTKAALSNESANKLFDEAMQLIRAGANSGDRGAGQHEKALAKIHQIVPEHPESVIAGMVIANEIRFMGMPLAQFESHVNERRLRAENEIDHLVELPVDSRNQSLTQASGNLIKVNITKSGAYVVMGQQMTGEDLTKWINERFEKNPDLKVLIRCDRESKHLHLANVMSVCRHVGVPEANIAVRTEK